MFVKVAEKGEIAPGGMKAFDAGGVEIILCNDGGVYYAVSRRCGHMAAPLEKGTLVGYIITCPMHCSQFDAKTGRVLSGPMLQGCARSHKLPEGLLPGLLRRMGKVLSGITANEMNTFLFRRMAGLMAHVRTCDIKTFRVRVEGEDILVDVDA